MSENLGAEVTKWYGKYKDESQERHPTDHKRPSLRGQLIDPVAQLFEQRMNEALIQYQDLARFSAQAVLLEAPEPVVEYMGEPLDGRGDY